ncbi:MAG: LysR family transcriptional regulator [Saprospiraceae bacterium]|nr:LysR family transcriptional regulator [Saprospiraceae bacterium]
MELRQIKYFLGVAETLNFSRAAVNLNIVQPALSRQIQQLEQELGVVLFERNNRNVLLTPAGAYLRDEMIKLDKHFQDTLNHAISIQNGYVGTLRIGYPGSALYSILPEVLCLLQQKLPLLDGVLSEMAEVKVLDSIVNGHIDVCFSREEIYDHPKVCQRKLFSEQLALVVPEQHPLTKENFESLAQCREDGFILPFLADWQMYRQLIYSMFNRDGIIPRIAYESNFGGTIMRLVEKNLGVSILPLSYRMGSSLKVRFIPLKTETTLYLVWRTDDHSPIVRNFIDLCDEAARGLDLDFECG